MKTVAVLLLSLMLFPSCATSHVAARAQVPGDSDKFDVEATVLAVYNVVSGPAGRRDWKRFEALFAPGGQIVLAGDAERVVLTPQDYVTRMTPAFNEKGSFEHPVATSTVTAGDVAHVWSVFEGRQAANQESASWRGIRSFQLVRIGSDWKVQSLVSGDASAAQPLTAAPAPR